MEASTITGKESLALKVDKVADLLDCSVSKIYDLVEEGHLEKVNLSGGKKAGIRIKSHSLENFLLGEGVAKEKSLTSAEKVAAQQTQYRRSSRVWI